MANLVYLQKISVVRYRTRISQQVAEPNPALISQLSSDLCTTSAMRVDGCTNCRSSVWEEEAVCTGRLRFGLGVYRLRANVQEKIDSYGIPCLWSRRCMATPIFGSCRSQAYYIPLISTSLCCGCSLFVLVLQEPTTPTPHSQQDMPVQTILSLNKFNAASIQGIHRDTALTWVEFPWI